MPVPRPKGSAELIADRRRRALALLKSCLSLNEVARRIQCVASSVMRWRDAWRRCGADALKVGSSPGRPLKLKPAQRRHLMKSLSKGPLAHGYNTNVWTTARIAELDPAVAHTGLEIARWLLRRSSGADRRGVARSG